MRRILTWCYIAVAFLAVTVVFCVSAENGGYVAASAPAAEGVELPVIMYHSVLDSEARAGQYVVTPDTVESDLRYLRDHGYTTVLMEDVFAYVNDGKRLPKKPVLITFDDGYYNFYSYVWPMLEKLDMRAAVAVIGRFTDQYSASTEAPNNIYTCLSWEQLREMAASGRVEVFSHSYDMHADTTRAGLRQLSGESDDMYTVSVRDDLEKMQQRMEEELGAASKVFAYPYGHVTDIADDVVREIGFAASFSCYEHINVISRDAACLYNLGRFNRPYGQSSEEFFVHVFDGEK